MSDEMRKEFEGWPGHDPNPTLRDLVASNPPVEPVRTEAEDKVFAAMPGDDISEHPLGATNPFLGNDYSELKEMVRDPAMSREDQLQLQDAINEAECHHMHPYTSRTIPGTMKPPVTDRPL